eukprot:2343174-Pyramimonas_sp.AAC.1
MVGWLRSRRRGAAPPPTTMATSDSPGPTLVAQRTVEPGGSGPIRGRQVSWTTTTIGGRS